jgi:CheY-like chemotaxis protein
MLAVALAQSGAEVKTCADASEAFESFRAWKPAVLVSDIAMPGEDGYALINRVRGLEPEAGGRVAAIALTARVKAEDRQRALDAGFQAHVPKPADPFEIVETIAGLAGVDQRAGDD